MTPDRTPDRTHPPTLQTWAPELVKALGLDAAVPLKDLLELARDAAHGVERPAAPVATYLVGLAVGRGMAFEQACRVVRDALPPSEPLSDPLPDA